MPETIQPKLHHVNLRTTRQRELIGWYGTVVGLTTVYEFPMGAWLTNDDANHRLALLSFPEIMDDPEKRAHAGIDHLAFEYASFDELMDSYVRLRDLGITPRMCLDHGMTLSMYYHDPDGNAVELQVDNFGSWGQSKDYMLTSPEFHENPLGHFFDPERVNADRMAGMSFAEIRGGTMANHYRPDPMPDLPFALPPASDRHDGAGDASVGVH